MPQHVLLIGLSYKTAPVTLRERLAAPDRLLAEELGSIVQEAGLEEGVLLSTCNRVEMIGVCSDPERSAQAIAAHFNRKSAPDSADACLYRLVGGEAVRHLYQVACGMDSMILGEPQILGQVKEAFAAAQSAGHARTLLGRCFDRAFAVAKRVRTETGIAEGCVNVSSVACNLADQIFGDLTGRRALLVGAGEMSEIAAKALAERGAKLAVLNRSLERAQQLAKECGGEPLPLDALPAELVKADVVISSTSSPDFIIDRALMQKVERERKHRPLFFIDIAVPRDIDPQVRDFDNVFLYDIDDLQQVSDANLENRRRALPDAERVVEEAVEQYDRWLHSLQLSPLITALRERFRSVVQEEKLRTLPRLASLNDKERQTLDAMCEAVVNKLLHRPLTELKRGSEYGKEEVTLIEATQRLFQLELPEAGEGRTEP